MNKNDSVLISILHKWQQILYGQSITYILKVPKFYQICRCQRTQVVTNDKNDKNTQMTDWDRNPSCQGIAHSVLVKALIVISFYNSVINFKKDCSLHDCVCIRDLDLNGFQGKTEANTGDAHIFFI